MRPGNHTHRHRATGNDRDSQDHFNEAEAEGEKRPIKIEPIDTFAPSRRPHFVKDSDRAADFARILASDGYFCLKVMF